MPTNLIHIQYIGGRREIDDKEGKDGKKKGYRDMHSRSERKKTERNKDSKEREREIDTVTLE